MKKLLLFVITSLSCLSIHAQGVYDNPLKDKDVEYVQIVDTRSLITSPIFI